MKVTEMIRGVASEPLLQFLLLGSLLFTVDGVMSSRADDPRRIVIDAGKRQELAAIFEEGQGRAPQPEELQELIVTWSQNEILYREALQMGLDRGDEMIRQRLILKLRNVLFGNIIVDPPSEAQLESWFQEHRERYDRPERYDFEQFVVRGSNAEAAARALVAELVDGSVPSQHQTDLRSYPARPLQNLVALFGEEEARALLEAPASRWVAVSSEQGWHLARVTRRLPAQPAQFGELRSQVVREWQDEARKLDLAGALENIVEKYDVRLIGGEAPPRAELSRPEATLGRTEPGGRSL